MPLSHTCPGLTCSTTEQGACPPQYLTTVTRATATIGTHGHPHHLHLPGYMSLFLQNACAKMLPDNGTGSTHSDISTWALPPGSHLATKSWQQ